MRTQKTPQKKLLKIKNKYLRATLLVCLIYTVFGSLWIYLSDLILSFFVKESEKFYNWSTYKGWFFMFVTTILLFVVVRSLNKELSDNEESIRNNLDNVLKTNVELKTLNSELQEKIFEVKKRETELQESDEKFRLAIQGSNDCIWDWNVVTGEFWFPKTRMLLGYDMDSMANRVEAFDSLVHPDDWEKINQAKIDFIKGKNSGYNTELRLLDSTGKYRWMMSRGQVIINEEGSILRIIGYHSDISERKNKEEEIKKIAYFDNLTKLFNKFGFSEELKKLLIDNPKMVIGLALVDIDNFKVINDSYGHEFGDLVLVEIAKRSQKSISDNVIIGRTGGDTFEVIFTELMGSNDMLDRVIHFQEMFLMPFIINSREIYITLSIGVAMYPLDGKRANDLSKCAEMAMYKAKEAGRNCFQFYRDEMREAIIRKAEIELSLRKAIDQDEFELYFQPIIDLKKGNVFALESLIRWKSNGKIINPMEFIPLAEETGLIIQIGEIVIEKVCIALEKLAQNGHDQIRVGVNFSVKQFGNWKLLDFVLDSVDKRKIDRKNFIIEVTESVALQDGKNRIEMLEAFNDAGISITLDDFGTGYSSLSYLKSLPISCVKIDKSFTNDVVNSEEDKAILAAVYLMSKKFRYFMVAEGVETHEQLKIIKELGCRFAQGYLFSTPLPFNEVLEYLTSDIVKKSIHEKTITMN